MSFTHCHTHQQKIDGKCMSNDLMAHLSHGRPQAAKQTPMCGNIYCKATVQHAE